MKTNWLSQAITDIVRKPPRIVVHGYPKTGKTSFAAYSPRPVFVSDPYDEGIHTLKAAGLAPKELAVFPSVGAWGDYLEQLNEIAQGEHDYKSLVVDTIGGMESLCYEYVLKKNFGNSVDRFGDFGKGFAAMASEWKQSLVALDACRSRGMMIILIAHTQTKNTKNPEQEDYDKAMPELTAKVWGMTHKWADCILYCSQDIAVRKEGLSKKAHAAVRVFRTGEWPAAECGNRWNLPPTISMGDSGAEAWANFTTAIKEALEENRKDG